MTGFLASRRALLGSGLAALAARGRPAHARAQGAVAAFSLPIGYPGQVLGDGFLIRHGYACENTWYNPGWLHAGEDATGYGVPAADYQRRPYRTVRRRLSGKNAVANAAGCVRVRDR